MNYTKKQIELIESELNGHTEGDMEEAYDAMLDDAYGEVNIAGLKYATSRNQDATTRNARLIAAAPDLLVSLEKLIDILDMDKCQSAWEYITETEGNPITLAKNAIAKARGES